MFGTIHLQPYKIDNVVGGLVLPNHIIDEYVGVIKMSQAMNTF